MTAADSVLIPTLKWRTKEVERVKVFVGLLLRWCPKNVGTFEEGNNNELHRLHHTLLKLNETEYSTPGNRQRV
jgi:hypothetical protein